MIKNKSQKFYSVLQDLFIGAKLKGQSGYVNLMNIKTKYFEKINKLIEDKTNNLDYYQAEELYDKLYTFFDSYFSDGGAIFFSDTPVYKNIYAKIYSDREDVSLFWKTRDLYYVKTETNYQSISNLQLDKEDNFVFDFDTSELEHKKGNEKKELAFYFIGLDENEEGKNVLKFKVKYKNGVKYDRLKEILDKKSTDELKKYLIENIENLNKSEIEVVKNFLDLSLLNFKNKNKSTVKAEFLITEQENVIKSVKIELVITDTAEIKKYCNKKNVYYINENKILKAFRIYKKQNEIDYFIHKDARAFLKEQFDLYIYQYLANDLDTIFDKERLDTIRKIKEIAYFVIDLIGRFEDEIKKIWLKPKFVRKSNYVITLDRITNKEGGAELIRKIFESAEIDEQIKEWVELGIVSQDFKKEEVFDNGISKGLNGKYRHLPIDTKYFSDEIKYKILSLFDDLDNELDGWLIKSDNFQALNTILPKFKEKVQTIYIDPPFNTGSDFEYVDRFQDSTWLTLMDNRLTLARELLKNTGSLFLHLDDNANYFGRILLNRIYGKENYRNEIIWA